jgi:starch synthase
MNQDFSWYQSAKKYVKVYRSLLGLPEQEEANEPPLPTAGEPAAK